MGFTGPTGDDSLGDHLGGMRLRVRGYRHGVGVPGAALYLGGGPLGVNPMAPNWGLSAGGGGGMV